MGVAAVGREGDAFLACVLGVIERDSKELVLAQLPAVEPPLPELSAKSRCGSGSSKRSFLTAGSADREPGFVGKISQEVVASS